MATLKKGPAHIRDLLPDPSNRRKHNQRNIGMIVDSLHSVGAGRSIVIDEKNEVLAGNGVLEAAGEAGITRVKTVEADGNTIIAVRRTGLTAKQKFDLAMYDNRAAELAEWDTEQIKADLEAGEDLSGLFGDDELAALTSGVPEHDDWEAAMEGVQRDRDGFQQMTFSLSDDQVETVKRALSLAPNVSGEATGNPNANGNALAAVCAAYVS